MREETIIVINGQHGKQIYLGGSFPGIYLTVREAELVLLFDEYTIDEICSFLSVSPSTIDFRTVNLLQKFKCETIEALISILNEALIIDQLGGLVDISYLVTL